MTRRLPDSTCLGLLAAFCFGLPAAQAQTETEVEARRLVDAGVAALTAGGTAGVAEAFARSHALFPHPGTLKNLAASLEAAGRPADAWQAWNELLERYGSVISEAARTEALERRSALDQRLARVTVTTQPPGAKLEVDGRTVGTTPLAAPVRLEPGEHAFTARLEGRETATATVNLAAGDNPPSISNCPSRPHRLARCSSNRRPPARRRRSMGERPRRCRCRASWKPASTRCGSRRRATSPVSSACGSVRRNRRDG